MAEMLNNVLVEPYGFIYITTNMINGKKYLGQRKFNDGWINYLGSGVLIQQAIETYGKENFSRNIVCFCNSEQELNETEYELSVWLDVVDSDDWYNLVFGGGTTAGWHPTQATKDKIALRAKERLSNPANHPMYGKQGLAGEQNPMFGISPKERMDEETYQQWYENHIPYWESGSRKGVPLWKDRPNPNLGKPMSTEQKEILSALAKERYENPEDHPMFGKNHSAESRKKMSERKKNKIPMHHCKPVFGIELNRCFYSAKGAERALGIAAQSIGKCCKGKVKTAGQNPDTGEKVHWVYAQYAIEQGYIAQKDIDRCLQELEGKGDNYYEN